MAEADIIVDPVRDHLRFGILENEPDRLAHLTRPVGTYVAPGDNGRPSEATTREVRHQTIVDAEDGRFAGARRAGEQVERSGGDTKT
jgi:hypothetical protein